MVRAGAGGGRDHHVRTPTTTPGSVHRDLPARACAPKLDLRNEKINYKVREHSLAKVPVILVCGKREAEEGTVNVRRLGEKDQISMALADALSAPLQQEAEAAGRQALWRSRRRPDRPARIAGSNFEGLSAGGKGRSAADFSSTSTSRLTPGSTMKSVW